MIGPNPNNPRLQKLYEFLDEDFEQISEARENGLRYVHAIHRDTGGQIVIQIVPGVNEDDSEGFEIYVQSSDTPDIEATFEATKNLLYNLHHD